MSLTIIVDKHKWLNMDDIDFSTITEPEAHKQSSRKMEYASNFCFFQLRSSFATTGDEKSPFYSKAPHLRNHL